MLIEENVLVKLSGKNKTYYEQLGYNVNTQKKDGEKFIQIYVDVNDLNRKSGVPVKVMCDYCAEEGIETIISVPYCTYTRGREVILKDACKKCRVKKQIDVTMEKYGVRSTALLPEVRQKQLDAMYNNYGVYNPQKSETIKEKSRKTNLEKYGVEYTFQSKQVKEKTKATILDRYGKEYYSQTEEYSDKIKSNNIDKYGVNYFFETDKFKEISKQTNLQKYGFENASSSSITKEKTQDTCMQKYGATSFVKSDTFKKIILKKYGHDNPSKSQYIRCKINKTRYYSGAFISSKQQRYICDVFNGKLNYPISYYSVDIAMPSEKIYVEYDGGGHNLNVLIGKMTQEEFINKELIRYYQIRKEGWNMIRIISSKDKIPSSEKLLDMIEYSKNIFNNGNTWIKFNIDNKTVESYGGILSYEFGDLRRIS